MRPGGGIGRRSGLKIRRPLKACGFDPHPGHSADSMSADPEQVNASKGNLEEQSRTGHFERAEPKFRTPSDTTAAKSPNGLSARQPRIEHNRTLSEKTSVRPKRSKAPSETSSDRFRPIATDFLRFPSRPTPTGHKAPRNLPKGPPFPPRFTRFHPRPRAPVSDPIARP